MKNDRFEDIIARHKIVGKLFYFESEVMEDMREC
jgi:hypothetical protein